jgi:hypothetical protein
MKKFIPLALLALTGCIPMGKSTHLVLGVGVFRVQSTNEVTVVKANTLGVHAGAGRLNVGLSSVMTASIPTNSNTILEIKGR